MPSTLPDPLAGAVARTETVLEPDYADVIPRTGPNLTCVEEITEKDGSVHTCSEQALTDARYCASHFVTRYHRIPTDKQRFREQLMLAAKTELLRISPDATRALEQLINNERVPANVRLKAATEVLDRVGVRGGTELGVTTEVKLNPSEDIRSRLESMAESMALAHNTIQSEVVDPTSPPPPENDDQLELELVTNNAVEATA